jgi:hypothetical protein
VAEKVVSKATELSSRLAQNLYGEKDLIKNLSLVQKLNPVNKNIGIGLTLVEGNSSFPLGLNNSVFSMMADVSKIKRKIVLPKDNNFNYSGLLIGPKGNSQKQLEERTGCRILVRGKGSQNQTNDYEDEEDLHVLVLGDNEAQVAKACA